MEGGRAANLSFDLRLGFTTGEIYSDTNAHKVALWLAKPTGARGLLGRRICVASSRIYLTPPPPRRRRRRSQHAGRRLIARLTAAIPIIRSFIWLQNC